MCHCETLRRIHRSFLARSIGRGNNNSTNHQMGTLMKMGSEGMEAIKHRRRILFTEIVVHMQETRLPKCVMFGELVGGAGCVGGAGRRVDGASSGRPQNARYRRPVIDDCSLGRGGMAQDGGTRGGTFHGEMDRCRESQDWTTRRRSMTKRDGKDQGENSL